MEMNDAELTWLTNHFGYIKDVHFQWYRKEDAILELTKAANVLVAVDDGQSVKNKRIDQRQQWNKCLAVAAVIESMC